MVARFFFAMWLSLSLFASSVGAQINVEVVACGALQVSIVDPEGVPQLTEFRIERRAYSPCMGDWEVVHLLPRQPGVTHDHIVGDPGVEAGTAYTWRVTGSGMSNYDFWNMFDPRSWGFPIQVYAFCGAGALPLGHGRIESYFDNDPRTELLLVECDDSCTPNPVLLFPSQDLQALMGSGTEVELFGSWEYKGNCCGTRMNVTQIVPRACSPVAVEQSVWSFVKRLFR